MFIDAYIRNPAWVNSSAQDKMAAITQMALSSAFWWNIFFFISIGMSRKFVPKGEIDNKKALNQVMTLHRTGDYPLPEQMLTLITDAYLQHYGEMS